MYQKFSIKENHKNTRFDKWFKLEVLNLPQSLLQKILRKKKIKVNNKKIKANYRLQLNDFVEIFDISHFHKSKKENKKKYTPQKKELKKYDDLIIDNNENFIILNKPQGIPVQGGTKSFKNLIDILSKSNYFIYSKPFVVHRIDKETSGILIVAKNRKYAQLFTSLFRIRKIHKTYLAITYGEISKSIKKLEDNLVNYDNKKKIIQKAITYVKIIKTSKNFSLLELNPLTGRKHQIRKQLYNIGHPVVGDKKYFIKKDKNKNLFLHAYKIKFMIDEKKYNYKATYNKTFSDFIKSKFR